MAGPRVATGRFKHNIGAGACALRLVGDGEAKLDISYYDRPTKNVWIGDPGENLLERRGASCEGKELLGLALAGQRPQPGAGAATDNDWRDQARRHLEIAFLVGPVNPEVDEALIHALAKRSRLAAAHPIEPAQTDPSPFA